MKSRLSTALMGVFALAIAASLLTGTRALALSAPGGGLFPCPWADLNCLDVWDPVTCSDGNTYSNMCYALRACQFDCTGGFPAW